MNANRMHPLLSSLVVAMAIASPAHAAPADCTAPKGIEQQRACKAATGGTESLRRFAERTRGVYNIYVYDYDNAIVNTQALGKSDATRLAERK